MTEKERLALQEKAIEICLEEFKMTSSEFITDLIYFFGKMASKFERDELQEFVNSSYEIKVTFGAVLYIKNTLKEMINETQQSKINRDI